MQIGDEIAIHDHIAISVDGQVIDGEVIVDQFAIAGEMLPLSVSVGEVVRGGWVVMRGRLVAYAPAVGNETTLGRIISRVEGSA
ncbi:hypothetical protein A5640_24845 [Mycobacterium asiaticum]|uniref:P-type ATPase A domain-containing protein n=1 Tax=Mycobacterium asiaticum TaxID=1790 RepID=A0A1A3KXX1_MYCAS|nr:hypothetical protein A5640_24845 [Mycobacterium asiaticum]